MNNFVQNILRSIFVCVAGFIISFAVFLIFFRYENKGDILVGFAMFMIYVVFLVYSLVIENILLSAYKKNHLNAFITTYSMAFIYILFYLFSEDKGDPDFLVGTISSSAFILLQMTGYWYQKVAASKIKKGKDRTV
ncbi:hypothetical protein [Chryseobacterium wangxinyae]|uniref:hypothetical protein n=1 Tax=Chryseobacterium sp. CY353 TaxID=2997334 RepID=UPI0022707A74|nr:hypothetical protein [Chryseobacterium sp. CY353]MCY0967640.1 hypothetical protein [Chryseobacterium sp. CY353]